MYQCFHCLRMSVIWDSDCSFEDVGREGEGIVHFCHCANCGAEIEYYISLEEEGETYGIEEQAEALQWFGLRSIQKRFEKQKGRLKQQEALRKYLRRLWKEYNSAKMYAKKISCMQG